MKDVKYHIGTVFYFIALIVLYIVLSRSYNENSITFMGLLGDLSRPSYYLTFAILFKTISETPNLMNNQKGYRISWSLIFILSLQQIQTGVFWSFYFCFVQNIQSNIRFLYAQSFYLAAIISLFITISVKAKKESKIDRADTIRTCSFSPTMDKTIRILTLLVLILFILSALSFISLFLFALPENANIPPLDAALLTDLYHPIGIAQFFLHIIEAINPFYLIGCISYLFSSVNAAALILFKLKSGLRIKSNESEEELIVQRFPKFDNIFTGCLFALFVLSIFSGVILAFTYLSNISGKISQPLPAILLLIESTGMMCLLWMSVRSGRKHDGFKT